MLIKDKTESESIKIFLYGDPAGVRVTKLITSFIASQLLAFIKSSPFARKEREGGSLNKVGTNFKFQLACCPCTCSQIVSIPCKNDHKDWESGTNMEYKPFCAVICLEISVDK